MKRTMFIAFVLMFTFGLSSMASAHVTVQPKEVPANSYQIFTVRVPSEKESATTVIKIAIPEGVMVSRFEPKPEWTYELEKDADGMLTSVTWKATGTGLGSTEFGEFRMQGKVAEDAKELVWKAYQTYADGEVVEWIGAADADKPASVTAVTAATGDGHGGGHDAAATEASNATASENSNSEGRDPLTLSLAIAGLAAGVLALLVAMFRRRT